MSTDYAARPQGVRITHPDGSSTPCELGYAGRVDGVHLWEVATPLLPGDSVYVALLPAGSAVTVASLQCQAPGGCTNTATTYGPRRAPVSALLPLCGRCRAALELP